MANTADDYAKWIVANEHLKGTPDFDTVAKAYQEAKAQEAQAPQQQPDNGIINTLHAGVDNAVNNFGSTVGHIVPDLLNNSVGEYFDLNDPERWRRVGKTIADSVDAPKNYQSPQVLKDPNAAWNDWGNYDLSQLPRAALEQVPNMAGALGATYLLGPAGGVAYGAGQTYGPTLDTRMENNGYTSPDQLTASDKLIAGGTSLAAGGLEALGIKGSSKLATNALAKLAQKGVVGRVTSNAAAKAGRLVTEGTTEGAQTFGEQAGGSVFTEKGLSLDGAQAIAAGLTGAGSRAITMAPTAPIELIDTVMGPQMKVRDREGATYFANRIERISSSEGVPVDSLEKLNYANPSDSKVFKTANKEIRREVVNNYNAIKPLLADLSIEDKSVVEAGIMAGQNLFEGITTKDAMQLIQDKAGHTQEGQNLIRLLRESNEASNFMVEMRKSRKGGISGKVDDFLRRKAKEITTGAAAGALGTAGVLQVAGALPAALAVAAKAVPALVAGGTLYAGARALDKVTGRRSKAARYLEDYAGRDVTPVGGESIVQINQRQLDADNAAAISAKRAGEVYKETSTRLFRQALDAFQSNDPNYAIPDRSWLAENSDYLTEGHYNALEKRIRLNEERAAKDEKDYNKQVEDEFRNRILKDLTDASRGGGRIPPEMLEQYKPFLTPAEYDRFVTRQNVEDKRVVAFAYQMANQKAAQAEAEAKADERLARELERDNRRDEAAKVRADAETKRAKAAQDKADAKAVADSVKAELARMKYTGTLNYDYINDHADILGPQINTWLNALKAQQKADRKAREGKIKGTQGSGTVHRGKRSASAAIPTETPPAPQPQPTPAVSAEAIGDPNNPVWSSSPPPSSFATGMNTGQVRVKEAFDNKVDVTEAMQDAILATAEALKGTDQDDLSFALQTFVELIAGKGEVRNRLGGAKNNPAERFKVFKSAIKSLGDDKEAIRKFRRETEDLMLAFGNPLEGDAMDDYVAWKKDNRDTAP